MTQRIFSAGQLDTRVQFQRRAPLRNALREPIGAWVDDGARVWARVMPLRAEEQARAGSGVGRTQAAAVVRFSRSRTAQDIIERGLRLMHGTQPYDIVGAIAVDGGTEWIELTLISGVRDGRPT